MSVIWNGPLLDNYRSWNEGFTAAEEHRDSNENPFSFGSEAHRYWELGRIGWPFPKVRES